MKKTIRLTENDLEKIFRRILSEQPDEKMPGQIERFGYNSNNPKSIGQSLDKQEKYFQEINKNVNNFIKGLGVVTAISAAFDIFKEALMKNQKVADAVGTVMTTISNVFSALIEIISNVIERVGKSSNGFEALGKVVMGAINLAFVPLKMTLLGLEYKVSTHQGT